MAWYVTKTQCIDHILISIRIHTYLNRKPNLKIPTLGLNILIKWKMNIFMEFRNSYNLNFKIITIRTLTKISPAIQFLSNTNQTLKQWINWITFLVYIKVDSHVENFHGERVKFPWASLKFRSPTISATNPAWGYKFRGSINSVPLMFTKFEISPIMQKYKQIVYKKC